MRRITSIGSASEESVAKGAEHETGEGGLLLCDQDGVKGLKGIASDRGLLLAGTSVGVGDGALIGASRSIERHNNESELQ